MVILVLFHNVLSGVLGTKSTAKVMEQLLKFPAKEYTGRELASYAGVSQPQTDKALKLLRDHGLVQSRQIGRAYLWKLSEKHFLLNLLKEIANPLDQAQGIILKNISKKVDLNKIDRIVLFGSVARGNERPSSDLDLLVVVKKPNDVLFVKDKMLDVSMELSSVFGNSIMSIVHYSAELESMKDYPVFKNIEKEGVRLYPNGERA